ncbi:MAG: hypothetical protein R3D69_09870 [Xanthobacteraceae bacterium]
MKIITLVAVAALAATPALAASGKKKPHRHHHHQRTQLYVTQDHPGYWRNSHNQYRSMDVYSYDGRLIGRDPDPNIRQSLRDEDWFYRYGP